MKIEDKNNKDGIKRKVKKLCLDGLISGLSFGIGTGIILSSHIIGDPYIEDPSYRGYRILGAICIGSYTFGGLKLGRVIQWYQDLKNNLKDE